MNGKIIFTGLLTVIFYLGCEKNPELKSTLNLNDTAELANFETIYNFENNLVLRMDTVLSDSRCPTSVQCVWEGNAEVRFLFSVDGNQIIFTLNTHGGSQFNADTIISGYRIQLLNLSPYPENTREIPQVEYFSDVIIYDK